MTLFRMLFLVGSFTFMAMFFLIFVLSSGQTQHQSPSMLPAQDDLIGAWEGDFEGYKINVPAGTDHTLFLSKDGTFYVSGLIFSGDFGKPVYVREGGVGVWSIEAERYLRYPRIKLEYTTDSGEIINAWDYLDIHSIKDFYKLHYQWGDPDSTPDLIFKKVNVD